MLVNVNMSQLEIAIFQYEMSLKGKTGSFFSSIFNAIRFADTNNIKKLATVFPHEVLAHLLYIHGNKFKEFLKIYGIQFLFENNYIKPSKVDIDSLGRNIEKAWEEMKLNKTTSNIIEFIVDGSNGSYILNVFGEMFEIEELKRDPYENEDYWDVWTYEIEPKCQDDIKAIAMQYDLLENLPREADIIFEFTEGGGDLVLSLILPDDYWETNDDENN
jgi:hypothetical protein